MQSILKLLESDSRLDASRLAILLGKSEAEVAAEIKNLEDNHIILGYKTLIDWEKTAEEMVTALIEVQVTPQRGSGFDGIAEQIYQFDEVESLYLMSGGYDFTVILVGKTMKDVATFVATKLSAVEGVRGTATHFILKKYKDSGVLFDVQEERQEPSYQL